MNWREVSLHCGEAKFPGLVLDWPNQRLRIFKKGQHWFSSGYGCLEFSNINLEAADAEKAKKNAIIYLKEISRKVCSALDEIQIEKDNEEGNAG